VSDSSGGLVPGSSGHLDLVVSLGNDAPVLFRRRRERLLPIDRDEVLDIFVALADIYANVLAIRDFLEADYGDTEEEA